MGNRYQSCCVHLGRMLAKLPFMFMALIMVGLLFAPACKSKTTEIVHIKMGILPFMSSSPFYLAYEAGYFADQGIELEFVKFTSAATLVTLLSQGELDAYAASMTPGFINGVTQGLDVKIVAGREYNSGDGVSAALLVRKDLYDSGAIDTVAELKGHKVAISSIGSISHFALSVILKEAGLTLADVQLAPETSRNAIAAFESKAMEASTLGPPDAQTAVSMGLAVILDSLNRIMPGFQSGFVMFGPNLLEKNPEAGKKFMVAYMQGIALYNQGKTAENISVISKYLGMTEADVTNAYWTPIYSDARIISQDILSWQSFYAENSLIDKTASIEDLVDTTYLKYATKIVKPAS